MLVMSTFWQFLPLVLFLFASISSAVPSTEGELYTREFNQLARRGGSRDHNPKKEAEAKKAGQLPWKELQCECKVSEQNIPVIGNMGWHFDLRIKGFGDGGDKAPECGLGILDNLHGECHTKTDIRQWYCAKEGGPWGRHISWDSSKTLNHAGIEMALWRASYEQMGGCKCDFNYAGSLTGSIFSGIAMAVPIPAAQAVKGVAVGAMTAAKAVANVAKSAASNLAKTAVKNTASNGKKSR